MTMEEEADYAYDMRIFRKNHTFVDIDLREHHKSNARRTFPNNRNENHRANVEEEVEMSAVGLDYDYITFLEGLPSLVVKTSPVDAECVDRSPVDAECVDRSPVDAECVDRSPVDAECVDRSPVNAECVDRSPADAYVADPQYKMFLEKLRVDENSYVVVFDVSDGVSVRIKYEMKVKKHIGCESRETKIESITRDLKAVMRKKVDDRIRMLKRREEEKTSSVVERKIEVKAKPVVTCTIGQESGKRKSQDFHHPSPKRQHNLEENYTFVDENYMLYLNELDNDTEFVVSTPEIDHEAKKTQDDESSCDSDVIVLDNPFSDGETHTPFVTSKLNSSFVIDLEENIGSNVSDARSNHSVFREKLMDVLKKPYDENEYNELLKKVNERKPLERERNLRNRPKVYFTNSLGKSYLQQYTDLAELIESYEMDRSKALKVLRGFFYWLTYVIQAGAFKPWLDSKCLEEMF